VRRIRKAREQLAADEARLLALNEEIVQMNKELSERQELRRTFLEKPLNEVGHIPFRRAGSLSAAASTGP